MIGRAGAAVAVALAFAAPAHAASNLEVGMEDERLLLSAPVEAEGAVNAWAAAGVDVVRIHARWIDVSPGRGRMHRPRGFDAANHRSRRYDWSTLDRAIDLTNAAGMKVMLSVTGPGPLWTSRAPRLRNPRYKPDPRLFGRFVGHERWMNSAQNDRLPSGTQLIGNRIRSQGSPCDRREIGRAHV